MDAPFFYGQGSPEAQAWRRSVAALSAPTHTGLTDIEGIIPFIHSLASVDQWMTGQTILVNGGHITKQRLPGPPARM